MIDIVPFFWCFVMTPVVGASSSLADMQRLFHAMAGIVVVRSSFLRRFTNEMASFLAACIRKAVDEQMPEMSRAAIFQPFRDVLAVDSTVLALSDCLIRVFPGTRTNSSPAAAKVNAVLSVLRCSIRSVVIAEEKRSELRFLRIGKWVRDTLMLFDLGYFSYGLFDSIDRHGGFFISRLKGSANPTVVSDNSAGPGRRRRIEGRKLRSVVNGLKREVIDINVKVSYRKKLRGGKTIRIVKVFRLVGVFNETAGKHHLYITNVPIELMNPEQIAVAYRARWFVEMAFHELKNRYAMGAVNVKKAEVLRCLVLISVLKMLLSRAVLNILRRRLAEGTKACDEFENEVRRVVVSRTPELRFAAVFAVFGPLLIPEILRHSGLRLDFRLLENLMALAMIDPNRKRNRLCDQLRANSVYL